MSLSDTKIRHLKPTEKAYKVADEKGLYALVTPSGKVLFRLKYRFGGSEKTLSFGAYPDITLKDARTLRDEARSHLAKGVDPSAAKKAAKAASREINTFGAIAIEWYTKQEPTWAPATRKKRLLTLRNDLIPLFGKSQIDALTARDLLAGLGCIEERGAIETASNARQVLGQIFRYARVTSRTQNNPVADLQGALTPRVTHHRPALVEPGQFGELLAKIDTYNGSFVVKAFMSLLPLLFQRPGEVMAMRWQDIDLMAGEWRYVPPKTIKLKSCPDGVPHTVPLSRQAIDILASLYDLTGRGPYVFRNERGNGGHVSAGTANKALRVMGYDTKTEHCAHGFRSSARTLLDEHLGFRVELIEHQLAHQVRDALGRAYNRTTHLPQRKEMMQKWADYLDRLKLHAISPNVIVGDFGGKK